MLIILIKPLSTKAYDRRASGDCGTSGFCCIGLTFFICVNDYEYVRYQMPKLNSISQDTLGEVRNFIAGTSRDRKISRESLTASALSLLQTLPVARHAVLEYLAGVFDEAVNHHLLRSHVGAYSNNAGK